MSDETHPDLPRGRPIPATVDPARVIIPDPLGPGGLVAGRFQIESLIGRGGFGRVYRAFDSKLERAVALKLLHRPEGIAERSQEVLRFEEEARSVARLDHPHIVTVHDAGLEGETPWMVMKLVAGSSLEDVLKKSGPMAPPQAVRLLTQIASALSHAHRRGIVHRDVKPSNILVEDREGTDHAWLTDFGLARLLAGSGLTEMGAILGTPSYMAPEQATAKRVDFRTDLFALGSVAVEMITGQPPFRGDSALAILQAIIHRPPELKGLRETAGRGFEKVVLRCLAKSPEDRWQTAEELVQALETLATAGNGEPAPDHPRKWFRFGRRPAPAPWDGAYPLEVKALRKGFGFGKPILAGFDLQVPRGSVYALMGRNGSGKTTLIRTCLGLYRRDAGQVAVFGRDPEREGPAVLARVGLVPDTLAVDDRMKVGELLTFVSRFYPDWDQVRSYKLLALYDLPLNQKIRNLSRGMRTKIALVMALSHRPELLILDDPALGLDAVILEEFVESLEEAAREGATILIASHNYGEMERIATHAGLFKDGRLFLSDSISSLKARTCEVRLTFPDEIPGLEDVPNFQLLRTSGRKATGVVLDNPEDTLRTLRRLEPLDLEVRELSLREIFVHYLR